MLKFPHSSLSPPFHRTLRVQPGPDVCNGSRGDQAIENARNPRLGWKNASIVENGRSAGLGFSITSERAPRKLGGGVRNERRELATHAIGLQTTTVHTYTLQNLLHFHDEACRDCILRRYQNVLGVVATHQGGRRASPAQYAQSALDTPTSPLHTSDT